MVSTGTDDDLALVAAAIDTAGMEPTHGAADRRLFSGLPPLLSDPLADQADTEPWTATPRAAATGFGYRVRHTTGGSPRSIENP